MVRLQARSAFLIALAYVIIGVLRWHHPLGGGVELFVRATAGVLVQGNLLWLLLVCCGLPLARWPRLALGLPAGLVTMLALAGELAVGWNIDLPFYVGMGDPERLAAAGERLLRERYSEAAHLSRLEDALGLSTSGGRLSAVPAC